jgi:hypothetical protein
VAGACILSLNTGTMKHTIIDRRCLIHDIKLRRYECKRLSNGFIICPTCESERKKKAYRDKKKNSGRALA